jgi:hypothetical protein
VITYHPRHGDSRKQIRWTASTPVRCHDSEGTFSGSVITWGRYTVFERYLSIPGDGVTIPRVEHWERVWTQPFHPSHYREFRPVGFVPRFLAWFSRGGRKALPR